jgi:hypothetical protein
VEIKIEAQAPQWDPNMTADYGEIIRLANLSNRDLQGEEWTDFQRDIAKLGSPRINLAIFARAILAGRPYQVTSANPQTIACYRSLASYLGATVEEAEEGRLVDDGPLVTRLVFVPPARQ